MGLYFAVFQKAFFRVLQRRTLVKRYKFSNVYLESFSVTTLKKEGSAFRNIVKYNSILFN